MRDLYRISLKPRKIFRNFNWIQYQKITLLRGGTKWVHKRECKEPVLIRANSSRSARGSEEEEVKGEG